MTISQEDSAKGKYMQDHIVKSFDEQIDDLNSRLNTLAEACRFQIIAASQAFENFDADLAQKVVEKDEQINEMHHGIEELCIRLIGLRQPMAGDLRYMISCMKISAELERIADYCANVAKRTTQMSENPSDALKNLTLELAQICNWMLKNAMTSFFDTDAVKAVEVWKKDGDVDELFARMMHHVRCQVDEHRQSLDDFTQVVFIARCFERIGDHITNVAEDVCFYATGPDYMDLFEDGQF